MSEILYMDGLVGPTHNYAGLSKGNLASAAHKGENSSPRAAALQGLEKMRFLQQMGIQQAFILPQPRPYLELLSSAGFQGSVEIQIEQAYQQAPLLLHACYSASSMWAANAATVTASADSRDHKVHFTPANLISSLHRSIESTFNRQFFQQCFFDSQLFIHHPPLPSQTSFSDEGSANQIRLSDPTTHQSLNLFIYGKGGSENPAHFPARQSLLACQSLFRAHKLNVDNALILQQNPRAIDQGTFHNDVISLGLHNLLLIHEMAWTTQQAILEIIKKKTIAWQEPLHVFEVTEKELSLKDAVSSYLFNSQLIDLKEKGMMLLAPEESRENKKAYQVIKRLLNEDTPVKHVQFFNLNQSMNNGGGPACLRLAVPITPEELNKVNLSVLLTEERYLQLKSWICKYYRDQLRVEDLRDPLLVEESKRAYQALLELPGMRLSFN